MTATYIKSLSEALGSMGTLATEFADEVRWAIEHGAPEDHIAALREAATAFAMTKEEILDQHFEALGDVDSTK